MRIDFSFFDERNPKGREMFEKANTAYEFLCSRAAKASDAPDADNIVLILRSQSILFSRYSTELGSTVYLRTYQCYVYFIAKS